MPENKKFVLFILILGGILFRTGHVSASVSGNAFRPNAPYLAASFVKPGMKGNALTVVKDSKILSFPVEILAIVPQHGEPRNLIMVRALGKDIERIGGIAAGMSGSPVYIGGKLVGAIGYGWNFADHTLGLVTPIEDMFRVFDWPDDIPGMGDPVRLSEASGKDVTSDDKSASIERNVRANSADLASPMWISGISERGVERISELLDARKVIRSGATAGDPPVEYGARLSPGDAIGILLAWGDVSVGATGTVTAVSQDGRFLAFAHPFLGRGAIAYPVTRAVIHHVVPSLEAPFKIGTPMKIVGTATQDRPQGVGGRFGFFAPSVDLSLTFKDAETGRSEKSRFHVVWDPFIGPKLASNIFMGLLDDRWGRKGEGVSTVRMEVEGRGISKGWSRSNMFFSDKDLAVESLTEIQTLLNIVFLNQFSDIRPLGVHLDVEMTKRPKVMFIERIEVDEKKFVPGQKVSVRVKMRPYRGKQVSKEFSIVIPKNANGECEILVRGGGIEPLEQDALDQGWKTIESFAQMFQEMSALERNNEVILELNYDKDIKTDDKEKKTSGASKEEREFLSEVKKRRLKDGTLQIFLTDYVVEGLLRKMITVKGSESTKETDAEKTVEDVEEEADDDDSDDGTSHIIRRD